MTYMQTKREEMNTLMSAVTNPEMQATSAQLQAGLGELRAIQMELWRMRNFTPRALAMGVVGQPTPTTMPAMPGPLTTAPLPSSPLPTGDATSTVIPMSLPAVATANTSDVVDAALMSHHMYERIAAQKQAKDLK